MVEAHGTVRRPGGDRRGAVPRDPPDTVLHGLRNESAGVVLLGVERLGDCWGVLADAGLRLLPAADVAEATRALAEQRAQIVIADAARGRALTAAVRARPELASAHIILCVTPDSPGELREALDVGADDFLRVPFEPAVLAARVAAGQRAVRLRANEALLGSLVANLPGAVYRCACDSDWTMEWLSDAIEELSGYPADDFVDSAVRTFASIIHPD